MRTIGYSNEAYIKTRKLAGQVLNRRSGRLSAGVHAELVEAGETMSSIVGIGPDLVYGKWHEEGGVFTVKQHVRTIRMAFGRPIPPTQVTVKSHTMTLPKRSWLRSALAEQRESNLATLRRAVEGVSE
jgi:hypothetical protein